MSQLVVEHSSTTTPGVDFLRRVAASRLLSPEWLYLLTSIVFGTAFVCLTPPFQVPDENAHFLRALQISEGRLVSVRSGNATGDYLPSSVLEFGEHFRSIRFNPRVKTSSAHILMAGEFQVNVKDRVFVGFSNAAIHPPLPYLPQAMGMFLARQFTGSLLILFYAGRCMNLAVATLLMFQAIRLTPIGKWVFTILALTPMTVFLAASLSCDALTNGFAFLLIAYVLRCASDSDKSLTLSHIFRIAVLGCIVGLCKQAYFLLPACYILIPASRLATRSQYWLGFGMVIGATFLSVSAWAIVLRGIYSPADTVVGMDPHLQIQFIITHPLEFLRAVLRTLGQAPMYLHQYIGVLGWLDTRLPRWVVVAEIIVIAVVCLADTSHYLKVWQCLSAVGIAMLVGATVMVIIYLTWEPVGSGVIHLQGRYFIPIGPLFGIAIAGLKVAVFPAQSRTTCRAQIIAAAALITLLIATFYSTYGRYFVVDNWPSSDYGFRRQFSNKNEGGDLVPLVADARTRFAISRSAPAIRHGSHAISTSRALTKSRDLALPA